MTTATIEKNYKRLASRLENLERLVKTVFEDELTTKEIDKLEKTSKRLDRGIGKRLHSRKTLLRYISQL